MVRPTIGEEARGGGGEWGACHSSWMGQHKYCAIAYVCTGVGGGGGAGGARGGREARSTELATIVKFAIHERVDLEDKGCEWHLVDPVARRSFWGLRLCWVCYRYKYFSACRTGGRAVQTRHMLYLHYGIPSVTFSVFVPLSLTRPPL